MTMPDVPFVSVIIPAKNEERFVGKCLDAIAELDYPLNSYEVIFVDNNSTDGTLKIVGEKAADNSNLKIVESGAATIAGVRMDGFMAARGDVVGFLDGDCIAPSNWLKVGLAVLFSRQEISCVGFSASTPDESAPWVERTWHVISSGSRWSENQEVPWLSSFNLLIKRNFFEMAGGFDRSLQTCEDVDLGFKLNEISRLMYSRDISVTHLGNVKSIVEFFHKELWRGKNNLTHFIKTNNKKKVAMSVLVPPIYLSITFICFLASLVMAFSRSINEFALLSWLIVLGIPVSLVIRKKVKGIGMIIKSSLLYTVYLIARGMAIVTK